MTDEIRQEIEWLRALHKADFPEDSISGYSKVADSLEQLLAVYEAAQNVRYGDANMLAMSRLTDALEAVQTRQDDDG